MSRTRVGSATLRMVLSSTIDHQAQAQDGQRPPPALVDPIVEPVAGLIVGLVRRGNEGLVAHLLLGHLLGHGHHGGLLRCDENVSSGQRCSAGGTGAGRRVSARVDGSADRSLRAR